MKIVNEFTNKTIELERSRSPLSMNMDDLYWCFETEVKFYKINISLPVLTIDETSFFSFLAKFKEVVESVSNDQPGTYTINDQEGCFELFITNDGKSVEIKKTFPLQSFKVPLHEFLSASRIWMNEAKKNIEYLFPELKENPSYINLDI
ncbi:MAG: hypothetical protein GY928_29405 [Colwellia sp.]|nr:hypothetical protein [Colwellia sp.]